MMNSFLEIELNDIRIGMRVKKVLWNGKQRNDPTNNE